MKGISDRWVAFAFSWALLVTACSSGGETPDPPLRLDGEPARSLVVVPDAGGAAQQLIRVYEPADGQRVSVSDLSNLTFRWSSVEGAVGYAFVTNDEVGTLIWRTTTRDTFVTLSSKAVRAMMGGTRLKWIVQVQELSASTDIYRVELLP